MQSSSMQEATMTEHDWAIYLTQWEGSFNNDIPAKSTVDHTPEPRRGQQSLPIIRKGRPSAKAHFFVTEDSMSGVYGFWCPKKLIDRESDTHVDVPDWFEMNVIEFT
tara:strand:+ start:767 stop:1087 length:321 start_codon:yes stop_codon:yes gene_type:complete